jgi:hypothetical protein
MLSTGGKNMSQTQIQAPSGEGKISALTIDELKERVKIVEKAINEMLPYINELNGYYYEADEKIAEILEVAVPRGLIFENLFKMREILQVSDIYDKYFPGWLDDECVHYLLVKLTEDKYALIYSCSELFKDDKLKFSIAINGESIE